MKNILIPTDFSENAKNALKYAITNFNNGEQFFLLHTYEETRPTGMVMSISKILAEDAENGLKNQLSELKSEGIDVSRVKPSYSCGELDSEIETFVRNNNIDTIVMGTKGASGIKEILMGSNTANLIKKAIKPLIAVPNTDVKKLKTILLPLNFEHIKNFEILTPVKELSIKNNAEVHVLYVSKTKNTVDQASVRAKLDAFFGDINHTYHYKESEEVVSEINNFAHEKNADLIAMIPRKGNFFDSIFHKSVTNKVALKTDIPLFAINDLSF